MPAGDQLQHPADQAEAEQQARLHALRGQDGVGEHDGVLSQNMFLMQSIIEDCQLRPPDAVFYPINLIKPFNHLVFVIQPNKTVP